MNTYTAMAGKAALDLVVPMALEVGKNLANKAGKGILSRTRQLNKPRKEANTGIIPHISGAPTAVGTRFQASKPRFNTRGQTVTLSHREMLTSINMTSSPSVTNEKRSASQEVGNLKNQLFEFLFQESVLPINWLEYTGLKAELPRIRILTRTKYGN
jgi:hypothetical protein